MVAGTYSIINTATSDASVSSGGATHWITIPGRQTSDATYISAFKKAAAVVPPWERLRALASPVTPRQHVEQPKLPPRADQRWASVIRSFT